MKPVNFSTANKLLTRPLNMARKDCGNLCVYNSNNVNASCWKLSIMDRLNALIFGKVWLYVRSGNTQPPVKLKVYNAKLRVP